MFCYFKHITMEKYKEAIRAIINFKKVFDKINPKVPRKLVGEIGEFYLLKKFKNLRLNPENKGGRGGYDIYLKEIDKRIEVRTSLLKNEGIFSDKSIRFWGWRVEGRNQKKSEKFDYLVCVALDDNFANPRFYIFTHEQAFSVGDVLIGRFNNVKKKITLFETKNSYRKALKIKPEFVTGFERMVNNKPQQFLNKWHSIKG